MKTKCKYLLGAFALGLIMFNFSYAKYAMIGQSVNHEYALENIATLKASAGEMYCDATNELICQIGQGTGTGRLVIKD